jgi:predicted SAM-dependent methyltransferase
MLQPLRQRLKGSSSLVASVHTLREMREALRQTRLRRRRTAVLEHYQRTAASRRLHLGAGLNVLPGWLNTDLFIDAPGVFFLDATAEFPLESASFDFVFSEHVIEHLSYRNGYRMLTESFRVLRPYGRIRIATPSLDRLIALYSRNKTEFDHRYMKFILDEAERLPGQERENGCVFLNYYFRAWGHQFIYDWETLSRAVEAAGFIDVRQYQPGESDMPELRGIEYHGKALGSEEVNLFETMVLEARRPG